MDQGPKILQVPSPNFGPRRHGLAPDMVVLHYTAMQTAQAAIDRLCDPIAEVSAHYVICEMGQITQLVDEDMRAWHAGAGQWGNVSDVNSHSVGIELANAGSTKDMPPFPLPQMDALSDLLKQIQKRWAITKERVIGHSDLAPDRKFDPGPKFDWKRLGRDNLAIAENELNIQQGFHSEFRTAAYKFGYRPNMDNTQGWAQVLDTFRLRFLPSKTGDMDQDDIDLMCALANTWPCQDVDLGGTSV